MWSACPGADCALHGAVLLTPLTWSSIPKRIVIAKSAASFRSLQRLNSNRPARSTPSSTLDGRRIHFEFAYPMKWVPTRRRSRAVSFCSALVAKDPRG